jgi:hypothetical protein
MDNIDLATAISILQNLKALQPNAKKAQIEAAFAARVAVRKERSVFIGHGYAIRFSEANTGSFSNVVLSLSALQKYDTNPLVICIVRPSHLDFRLANATLLKRISHSSLGLREDNIRGSFLGHDIVDEYDGVPNRPDHFDELMAIHSEFTWKENVARLVRTTTAIVARSTRFSPVNNDLQIIFQAPSRAQLALNSARFRDIQLDLTRLVERHRAGLLQASTIDNVNIRGNTIEQIITGGLNGHRLDDLTYRLRNSGTLTVDIKTKLLDRASAPKAYNIDKLLRILSEPGSVFCLYFIAIHGTRCEIQTRLVSIFDPIIVAATRIQTHWAGRSSRGVTQLTGNLGEIFSPHYRGSIDVEGAASMLKTFIER